MRRLASLVLLALVGAAVAVASARADGTATTTSTTTTATPTTTTALSFAPLASSSLPAACVGAGAAALVLPSQRVIAFGTPASNLGPSAYRSVLSFDSAGVSGSTCKSGAVSLSSVSLFDGVVTASSVQATDGKGSATGIAIDGSAVTAAAGQTVPVEDWGQLTLGATLGRVTAPLVLRLLQAHDSLPAGTAVVVAFGASARSVPTRMRQDGQATGSSRSPLAGKTSDSRKLRQRARRPTPDFPASRYPLKVGSLTDAARDNPVVSTAVKYLGVPYQWGGASPAMGFDCSGLVKFVFGKLGVSLPHYAASQWYSPNAVWVAPNRLQPGDLVFFVGSDGTRKSPGHVGIYVDDGYIIDAPHTGSFVRIDSLGEPRLADGYVGAKRIVSGSLDRRLLGATKRAESTAFLPGFPAPLRIEPLAESLGVAAAGTAATPSGLWWGGIVLGGLLLLLLAGGGVLHRRALRPDRSPIA
jgi:cell wall-associated NlpC family hydrolase